MAIETELKLKISPKDMARLKRHPLLRSLSSSRSVTRKLYSIYFDTPDLYFHKHAMALRLRQAGRQWLQTLKGGGAVQAGLHQRNEWETVVPDEALDFVALEACGAMHLPKHIRKKLQAVFVTDFSRSSRMVNFEGASIELSMDSGETRAGNAKHVISELELELKSGEPLQLFRLALLLLDLVPLQVESVSKAEYGYRLWSHTPEAVSSAVVPALEKSSNVAVVLQGMIWSCLHTLQANVPGAVHKLNNEYLHQMRVSLRRLRVVLGMAAKMHTDDELDCLRKDVATLAVELGHLREWDVFVTHTLLPLQGQPSLQVDIEPVLRSAERQRSRQHERVRKIIQSQDFQRLLLRFGVWMLGEYWLKSAAGSVMHLRHFAVQVLHKRSNQVSNLYSRISSNFSSETYPAQLHMLRIACKKLRYSAELFASLFPNRKVERYLSVLCRMQDILGWLHDMAVARHLLEQLGAGKQHETSTLIRDWLAHDYANHSTKLNEAWQKFAGLDEFWV